MLSGVIVQGLLQVLVLSVLARLLTPADFGQMSAALVVVGISAIFSQAGIGSAIIQLRTTSPLHLRVGFTVSLTVGLTSAAIAWSFAPALESLFRTDGLSLVIRGISPVFLLRSVSVVAEALIQRQLRFGLLARLFASSYLLGFGLLGIVLATLGFGVWALVGAHIGQALIKTSGLLFFQRHPMSPSFERKALQELLSFGAVMTIGKCFNYIATQADNVVVARWLGASALGVYSRAYQLMIMPATLFGSATNKVLFPSMALVQGERERLVVGYRSALSFVSVLTLPTSVLLFMLAPEVVFLLLGSQWTQAVLPFRVLCIGALFRTSYKISDSLAKATGAVRQRAWRQAVYALLIVGGSWIGQHWGIAGVAVAVVVATTTNYLLMAQLSLHLTGLSWTSFLRAQRSGAILGLLSVVVVGCVTFLCHRWVMPELASLAAASTLLAVSVLIAVRFCPSTFLDVDSRRVLRIGAAQLPSPVSNFLGRLILLT